MPLLRAEDNTVSDICVFLNGRNQVVAALLQDRGRYFLAWNIRARGVPRELMETLVPDHHAPLFMVSHDPIKAVFSMLASVFGDYRRRDRRRVLHLRATGLLAELLV